MWWIIPVVIVTLAFDVVTDAERRRAFAAGAGRFADWYIDEVGGCLSAILLPEQTAELDRQEAEGRRMLEERVAPPKCPVCAKVGPSRCLTHSRYRDIGAPPKPRQVTTCSRCAGVGPGHCPEHMHDQCAPMSDLTHAEVAAFVEHGTSVVPSRPRMSDDQPPPSPEPRVRIG